ncbi:MAG: hypothetical protein ACQCN4_02565 [Candidatus Bathyarchaeia archaeon]|jgi:DNA-directed RNA polymerase subunit RPC12/RpoP
MTDLYEFFVCTHCGKTFEEANITICHTDEGVVRLDARGELDFDSQYGELTELKVTCPHCNNDLFPNEKLNGPYDPKIETWLRAHLAPQNEASK